MKLLVGSLEMKTERSFLSLAVILSNLELELWLPDWNFGMLAVHCSLEMHCSWLVQSLNLAVSVSVSKKCMLLILKRWRIELLPTEYYFDFLNKLTIYISHACVHIMLTQNGGDRGIHTEIYIKKVTKNWTLYGKNSLFGGEGLLAFHPLTSWWFFNHPCTV